MARRACHLVACLRSVALLPHCAPPCNGSLRGLRQMFCFCLRPPVFTTKLMVAKTGYLKPKPGGTCSYPSHLRTCRFWPSSSTATTALFLIHCFGGDLAVAAETVDGGRSPACVEHDFAAAQVFAIAKHWRGFQPHRGKIFAGFRSLCAGGKVRVCEQPRHLLAPCGEGL